MLMPAMRAAVCSEKARPSTTSMNTALVDHGNSNDSMKWPIFAANPVREGVE